MSNITGTVKVVFETQEFSSGFQKREFVLTTDDKYPQDIKFEVVKDNCTKLNELSEGVEVTVYYNLRGNEYNGKYYVNLQAWKWDVSAAATPPTSVESDTDDIPF